MKKQIIKIDSDLDYVYLNVNGSCNSRWRILKDDELGLSNQDGLIKLAKIAAFDLLWTLTEMGQSVVINPYLN